MRREVVVAAAATGVVVTAGVVGYRYYWRKSRVVEEKPAVAQSQNGDVSAEPAATASGSVVVTEAGTSVETLVTEEELSRVLKRHVDALSAGKSIDRKRERDALRMLQNFEDVTKASMATRLLVAQYCAAVFSMKMVNPENRNLSYEKLMTLRESLERTYLFSAWEVLNAKDDQEEDPDIEPTIQPDIVGRWHALKLDVACRMHDSDKMEAAYNEAAKDAMCAKQDRLVLLASAALVGRWDEVRRIGAELAPSGELDVLHAASMKDPSMVDYASLFLLAAQIAGSASDTNLWEDMRKHEWNAYEMRSAKFKLVQDGPAPPLRPDITSDGWREQKPAIPVPLMRTGAIVHMVNPGAVPIPLSGFSGQDDMCLLGYFDVEQSGEQLRFTEFFTFKRDRAHPTRWVGKELSTMLCVVGRRAGEKISEVIMDVELDLELDRKSVWKAL